MTIKEIEQIEVYLPSQGGVICGYGIIRNVNPNDQTKFSKVYENEKGKIYFNNYNDRQIRGLIKL